MSKDKRTKRFDAPTPYLRLQVGTEAPKNHETDMHQDPLEAPIYLFVRKKGNKAIWRHHTNIYGQLCRFVNSTSVSKFKKGQRYKKLSRIRPYDPSAEYHGLASAEVQVSRKALKDSDLQRLSISAETKLGRKYVYVDWSVPKAEYVSFALGVLHYLKRSARPELLIDPASLFANGVSKKTLQEYQKLLDEIFPENPSLEYLVETDKSGATEEAAPMYGFFRDIILMRPDPYKPWPERKGREDTEGWRPAKADFYKSLENGYFFVGDYGLQASKVNLNKGKPKESQKIKKRGQIWQLENADVTPVPADKLGYDPAGHDAIAADLIHRFDYVAGKERYKGSLTYSEANARILESKYQPAHKSFPYPQIFDPNMWHPASKPSAITATNEQGIRNWTLRGYSNWSFPSAVVEALLAGMNESTVKTLDQMFDASAEVKGKVKPIEHEVPLASAAFIFATGHFRYDHSLIDVKHRVRAWCDTLPIARLAELGSDLKVKVDGYASEAGDAAYNKELSQARGESVLAALEDYFGGLNFDMPEKPDYHGEYTGPPEGPAVDCLRSARFTEEADYGRIVAESSDNSWKHRVVTVELLQKVRKEQVVTLERFTIGAFPIAKLSIVGAVATRTKSEKSYYVWVFLTPGYQLVKR